MVVPKTVLVSCTISETTIETAIPVPIRIETQMQLENVLSYPKVHRN